MPKLTSCAAAVREAKVSGVVSRGTGSPAADATLAMARAARRAACIDASFAWAADTVAATTALAPRSLITRRRSAMHAAARCLAMRATRSAA